MHLYIDVGDLLARCVTIGDIPLTDDNVRDFMTGFTQTPLFTVMDLGHGSETLLRRMKGICDSSWIVLLDLIR